MSEEKVSLYAKFDRFISHPIAVSVMTAYWYYVAIRRDWELSWFQWLLLIGFTLWFLWKVADVATRGKLGAWFEQIGENEEWQIHRDFVSFRESIETTSPFLDQLETILGSDESFRDLLDGDEAEEMSNQADCFGFVAAYSELCKKDDERAGELVELFQRPGSKEAYALFFQEGMPIAHRRY